MSGRGVIAQEPDQMCELCGTVDECRPYGPKGEQICFKCATATPEMKAIVERQMAKYLFGEDDE